MVGAPLLSCQQIPVKDEIGYGALGTEGAVQVHTLANVPSVNLSLQQFAARWNSLNDPLICLPASAYADMKEDLEKACTYLQSCTTDTQTAVDNISTKIDSIKAAADKVIGINKARRLKKASDGIN